jgi:Icc-related predicted phosphoesterase
LKIQFFSDIHLEFGTFNIPETKADVIVAAGDIGVGTQGIEWLAQNQKPIIYVAGHHEYYYGDIVHTRIAIAELAHATPVSFLENDVCEIDGFRFLGATLWTDYFDGNPTVMCEAVKNMNDYRQILYASHALTPKQLYDVNWESRSWLARKLEKPYAGKTVVVTHHAPTLQSWPATKDTTLQATYCNRLDDFFSRFSIDARIHGHVHAVGDYARDKTRIMCNPRGYTGHQIVNDFSAAKTIEL